MKDRCKRICGSESEHCFIDNKKQVACIADMVSNKVAGVLAVIELTAGEDDKNKIIANLNKIMKAVDELDSWVKFLQIVHDLRELNALLSEDGINEKRKEIRYPFPEFYQKYIVLKVWTSGFFVECRLKDFSASGLQFKCPEPIDIDSVKECTLSTNHIIKKSVSFKIRVRHCKKLNGEFLIGSRIKKVSDSMSFNFFRNVYDFIAEPLQK